MVLFFTFVSLFSSPIFQEPALKVLMYFLEFLKVSISQVSVLFNFPPPYFTFPLIAFNLMTSHAVSGLSSILTFFNSLINVDGL